LANFKLNYEALFNERTSKWRIILIIFLSPLISIAQIPINSFGTWNTGSTGTTTLYNASVGVATGSLTSAKFEVKFKPCLSPQNGLVITSIGCTNAERNNIPLTGANPNTTFQFVDLNSPGIPLTPVSISPVFTFTNPTWSLVKPAEKPMFWIREEDIDNSGNTTNFTSRFIVMPNGNTGLNTNNPRATLDVIQAYKGKRDEPTAIFGKLLVGTGPGIQLPNPENPLGPPTGIYGSASCQLMVFNNMYARQRNRIVQVGDQGLLFTDGGNTDGSNLDGGLVIAPWNTDYLNSASVVGGIRIDKNGKVEVHGDLRTTRLTVNARWWSDFVFAENYRLMSLSNVSNYIKLFGHLPGMPSEKQVLDSGINVADMQALHQQKIEELTLYSIAQEEKLKAQELQLEVQRAQIELQRKKQEELEAKLNLLLSK
jgi:hypothetical protein